MAYAHSADRFDPFSPDSIEASREKLEDFLLFGIFVQGKPAAKTRRVLDAFMDGKAPGESPFQYVRRLLGGTLDAALLASRCGQYGRIKKALNGIVKIDPLTCTTEDLEAIHGVGPKTSRFFLLYSRRGFRGAVLDRHVLQWLASQGMVVPKSTPSGHAYKRLETQFLSLCDSMGKKPDQLDFSIWSAAAKNTS